MQEFLRQQQNKSRKMDEDGEEGVEDGEESTPFEPWDLNRCLFCHHNAESFDANLEHMYIRHGFFFPDADYLVDPEGLLGYLGLKISVGFQPLNTSGFNADAKRFRSLVAVQHHMCARNECRMLYDGNEEEYEDFYDYTGGQGRDDENDDNQLALHPNAGFELAPNGMEIIVRGKSGKGLVLGHRELARYYKQRKANNPLNRASVQSVRVAKHYLLLSIPTKTTAAEKIERFAQRKNQAEYGRNLINLNMRENVNKHLPKGCWLLR